MSTHTPNNNNNIHPIIGNSSTNVRSYNNNNNNNKNDRDEEDQFSKTPDWISHMNNNMNTHHSNITNITTTTTPIYYQNNNNNNNNDALSSSSFMSSSPGDSPLWASDPSIMNNNNNINNNNNNNNNNSNNNKRATITMIDPIRLRDDYDDIIINQNDECMNDNHRSRSSSGASSGGDVHSQDDFDDDDDHLGDSDDNHDNDFYDRHETKKKKKKGDGDGGGGISSIDMDDEKKGDESDDDDDNQNKGSSDNKNDDDDDDDDESDEEDAESDEDLQPELYSEEFDDAIHLSDTHLFRQILKANVEKRRIGINNVIEIIRQHADELVKSEAAQKKKKSESEEEGGANSVQEDSNTLALAQQQQQSRNGQQFFAFYRSIIARFAYDSPFEDISSRFQQLADELRQKGIAMPKSEFGFLNSPSCFFTPTGLALINSTEHLVEKHFKTFFLEDGVVSHLARVLITFPQFAEIFYKAYHFAMRRDGPLPTVLRNYIAIMAASRHQCNYLIRRQEVEFLNNGGDPQWLRGIKYVPEKMSSLLELNAILAHAPWTLRKEHVERLVKPTGPDQDYSSLWSIAELVHAVVIMCHFHAYSGLVFGCGLLPDDDVTPVSEVIDDIRRFKAYKKQLETNVEHKLSEENEKVLQTLTKISNGEADTDDSARDERKLDHEEKKQARQSLGTPISGPAVLDYNNFDCFSNRFTSLMFWGTQSTSPTSQNDPNSAFDVRKKRLSSNDQRAYKRYLDSASSEQGKFSDMKYTDFDVRSRDYSVLYSLEFNWQSDCFPLLNRFYNGYADLLDQEFDFIRNMTENNFYKAQNVDTTAFRNAIWVYVQRLYGVLEDDYDYKGVNMLLNIGLKKYIKTVVCYPERTEREQFVDMGFQFKSREKIHVNLLAMEARKQVALVYALQQIENQYSH